MFISGATQMMKMSVWTTSWMLQMTAVILLTVPVTNIIPMYHPF